MDRRAFLKVTGGLLASSAVDSSAVAAEGVPPAEEHGGRLTLPINRNWRFLAHPGPGAHEPTLDDSVFPRITVPHSNVPLPWHSFDNETYEFISVYRRKIRLPLNTRRQRVFVDFEGVMLASTVYLNGKRLGQYRGGYTPFSFELTDHLHPSGNNLLSIEVDSTERADIPPFGDEVDYLTFGGIYREVFLRIVPPVFLERIRARTRNVLTGRPTVEVDVYLDRNEQARPGTLSVRAQLLDGRVVLGEATITAPQPAVTVHHPEDGDQGRGAQPYSAERDAPWATLSLSGEVSLWDLDHPTLYTVRVELLEDGAPIDTETCRVGFREAIFTDHGFSLNGKIVKLHGLDRHQTFPWVGQAMSARGQRQDARILRHDCGCNIVRTSHYPQSRHFLDACDELGLLVLEEIPGWQHIGDLAWQDISVDNVRRMIRRDWNHPSIILWGVRINESRDSHDFYVRTNSLARALDATRQTCGVRTGENYNSELLEDVFTFNDFGWPLRAPNHPRFLNTEFVGHTFPTKTIDAYERQMEHVIRHARVHDTLASDARYAGGLGWCAFDYATHNSFGSGDRICYHGVMDIFRNPKPAAGFYKSMIDPHQQLVLEPAFYWARNDESVNFSHALICANVQTIRMTTHNETGEHLIVEGGPDRVRFPHLPYPPFFFEVGRSINRANWGDLLVEGLIGDKVVITKRYSGSGVDSEFVLLADETQLIADGADAVRVVMRVNDEFGSLRHYAADAIEFTLNGPGVLIGDRLFGLIGGTGAVWVRTLETPGRITLTGTHPRLGSKSVTFDSHPVPPETA